MEQFAVGKNSLQNPPPPFCSLSDMNGDNPLVPQFLGEINFANLRKHSMKHPDQPGDKKLFVFWPLKCRGTTTKTVYHGSYH